MHLQRGVLGRSSSHTAPGTRTLSLHHTRSGPDVPPLPPVVELVEPPEPSVDPPELPVELVNVVPSLEAPPTELPVVDVAVVSVGLVELLELMALVALVLGPSVLAELMPLASLLVVLPSSPGPDDPSALPQALRPRTAARRSTRRRRSRS